MPKDENNKAMSTLLSEQIKSITPPPMDNPVIPTGNYWLDNKILMVGGFLRGKVTELFGKEQSGKSSIALHVVANAQKMGLRCAYIDTEGFLADTYGKLYATKIGVDLDALDYWYTVGPAENIFYGISQSMQNSEYGLVIIDSVPYLRTAAQLKGLDKPRRKKGGHRANRKNWN